MNTDQDWEQWGRKDPYFGVITHERFRRANLDDAARQEFFESGRIHVEYVLAMCRTFIDPHFAPRQAMDFGCGVGRVLIPLARVATEAMGLDVAPSMIEEARRNCEAMGVANARLAASGDDLSEFAHAFDLVHSCIVLQHIEPSRGRDLFANLLHCIRPGGIGAIQVTYAKAWFAESFGRDPNPAPVAGEPAPSATRRLRSMLGAASEPRTPDPAADPGMQMHSHDLNTLLFLMQRAGVRRFHIDFTDHGGELGVFIFFQQPASA